MKKFFFCLLCLFLVSLALLGMAIVTGSDELALGLLVIGCVFVVYVLPVIVVIAAIVAIGRALVGRSRVKTQLTGQQQPEGTVEVTLTRYMRKARAHGMSDDEIERRLRQNEWTERQIQNARQMCDL